MDRLNYHAAKFHEFRLAIAKATTDEEKKSLSVIAMRHFEEAADNARNQQDLSIAVATAEKSHTGSVVELQFTPYTITVGSTQGHMAIAVSELPPETKREFDKVASLDLDIVKYEPGYEATRDEPGNGGELVVKEANLAIELVSPELYKKLPKSFLYYEQFETDRGEIFDFEFLVKIHGAKSVTDKFVELDYDAEVLKTDAELR